MSRRVSQSRIEKKKIIKKIFKNEKKKFRKALHWFLKLIARHLKLFVYYMTHN